MAAYESVLQEEGIPYQCIDVFQLLQTPVSELSARIPALLLPDGLLQNVPGNFGELLKAYLARGGNVGVIYDPGTKNQKGLFARQAGLGDIVGLNYLTSDKLGKAGLDYGYLQFTSPEARDFLQFPDGKTNPALMLSGYRYGPLQYPLLRTEPIRPIPSSHIYAYGITASGRARFPLITLTGYLRGKVMYVGLPLGYLKANSDDLPLRAILRTFLFEVVKIPHLMNVAGGKGGIVINWHIDSSVEHPDFSPLQTHRLLRPELPYSFSITAGEFRDRPGDGLGFDAAGKGRPLVKYLERFGNIGSHGGWAHNWFYQNIENRKFTARQMETYIAKNNRTLAQITGVPVTEYAAPSGVHPQPVTTRILAALGIMAYYYTGDSGSGPNRTFFRGRMVSDRVMAFPVMPLGQAASLHEMQTLEHQTESEVARWLNGIADYTARHRTVRLFYSHPYDIQTYPGAVTGFIDHVASLQRRRQLRAGTMTQFAGFLRRFLKTDYSFTLKQGQLVITLNNPEGLTDITIAVPRQSYRRYDKPGVTVEETPDYYYLTLTEAQQSQKQLFLDRI